MNISRFYGTNGDKSYITLSNSSMIKTQRKTVYSAGLDFLIAGDSDGSRVNCVHDVNVPDADDDDDVVETFNDVNVASDVDGDDDDTFDNDDDNVVAGVVQIHVHNCHNFLENYLLFVAVLIVVVFVVVAVAVAVAVAAVAVAGSADDDDDDGGGGDDCHNNLGIKSHQVDI
uniref:Uncharacterized protein n=1 Tax=Glossina pallidipes TaxID=7398 RepID=A0A1B0A1W2_GLOPL